MPRHSRSIADLQTGDTLFAGITGKGGIPIYAKSNEETY